MDLPPDCRPLQIEGSWDRGRMTVGTGDEAVLQVKWWRPDARRFAPRDWMRDRARRMAAAPDPRPTMPPGFAPVASLPDAPSRGGGSRSLWYGWHEAAGMVLELAVNRGASAGAQAAAHRALPGLSAAPRAAPTPWCVYAASLESPPDFRLRRWRLYSGDIALDLRGPLREALRLRLVYPAATALARRPLAAWVRHCPFEEHRRTRWIGPPDPWSADIAGRRMEGVRLAGRKALAFPLQWIRPADCLAAGLRDERLDRLLLVHYDGRADRADERVRWAVERMNWAEAETNAPIRPA